MAEPAFIPQSQASCSGISAQSPDPLSTSASHVFGHDSNNPGASLSGASSGMSAAVLVRGLPLDISKKSIRRMITWSKELVKVELLPANQSEDAGFLSAILRFKSPAGAFDAKNMLDFRSNLANEFDMIVEFLSGSGTSTRQATYSVNNASITTSSAAPSEPGMHQTSRFDTFQWQDRLSPSEIRAIFAAYATRNTSPILAYDSPNSFPSPYRYLMSMGNWTSAESVIENQPATSRELLKDTINDDVYDASENQRTATLPHIPTTQLARLSLDPNSPPSTSSLPAYVHPSLGTLWAHPLGAVLNSSADYGENHGHFRHHVFPCVNPADRYPPCNTLYIGNMPIDTSYEELKAVFSKQPGYKRLFFQARQNGPLCFVEFEDVSLATKALHELNGRPLQNSANGGIRISFSKNPLGVRSRQSSVPNNSNNMSSMNGMMAGTANGFATANGPPPGFFAPPGLSSSQLGYGGRFGGHQNRHHHPYAIPAGFSGSNTNARGNLMHNGATAAGVPASLGSNTSRYQPPHMRRM